MTSQDGLALLKQMHQRGEITDEQYDTLRRHVLWGTPLPAARAPSRRRGRAPTRPAGTSPAPQPSGPDRFPGPAGYPDPSGRPPGEPAAAAPEPDPAQPPGQAPRRYASRRERPRPSRRTPRERTRTAARAEAAHPERPRRGGPPAARRKHRPVATGTRGPVAAAPRDGTDATPLDRPQPDSRPPERQAGGRTARAGRRHAMPRRRRSRPGAGAPTEPGPGHVPPEAAGSGPPAEPATPARPPVETGKRRARQRSGSGVRARRSVVAVLTSVVLALALAAGGVYWFELRRQGLAPPAYARRPAGRSATGSRASTPATPRLVNQISRQQNKTTIRADVTRVLHDDRRPAPTSCASRSSTSVRPTSPAAGSTRTRSPPRSATR